MGDLTLSQYQTRVLLALKNVRSTHPAVVAGLHTQAINDAANDLVRTYPDRFPEHNDNSWTLGPTIVGENKIALPDNLLVIGAVRSADSTTDPAGWEDTDERVVSRVSTQTIGLLDKASSDTGYPNLWDRKGTNLIYYPTTRTGYTTYLRVYGLAGETRLSAAGSTFRLHRDYDEAVVLFAAAKLARMLGFTERADELEAAAKRKMGDGISVVNEEAAPMVLRSSLDFGGCS